MFLTALPGASTAAKTVSLRTESQAAFPAPDATNGIRDMRAASYTLRPFEPFFASRVVSWVRDARELFWLAPATPYPLTPAKVTAWTRNRGKAFLLFAADELLPCGYGELNSATRDPHRMWLGHLVVATHRRRTGVGGHLTRALIDWAFQRGGAKRLTLVVFPANTAAIRCYLGCGFQLRGEEFQCFRGRAERHRLLRFELHAPHIAEAAASPGRSNCAGIG